MGPGEVIVPLAGIGMIVAIVACKQVAKRAGGVAAEVATEAGGMPGTDDVFSKFDVLVSSVAGALSGKSGGQR